MEKRDYVLDNFYSEGPSSFKPGDDMPQIGYKIRSGELGMTTDPRSANQLATLGIALNSGVVPIEVGVLNPETFDQIPKQHFAEMRRKAKLAESKISLHAPLVDPTGMTQQGWDETQQIAAVRQLKEVIDKAAMLDDKNNVPVTIHSSNYAGSTYGFGINEKTGKREKIAEQLVAINRDTGQLVPLRREEKYYPGKEIVSKEIYNPKRMLELQNYSSWIDVIDKIDFEKENAEKIIFESHPIYEERFLQLASKKIKPQDLTDQEQIEVRRLSYAGAHLEEAERAARAAFNKAYKNAIEDNNEKQIKDLNKISKLYGSFLKGKDKEDEIKKNLLPQFRSQALGILTSGLRDIQPNSFQTVEEFAKIKAADTLSKVALHTYENYEKKGKAAPILSIENLSAGMAFSQAKDLKDLIENTQKKFVNELIKKENISQEKANKIANKLIGATFDVGHMNINKKQGFTDKDIAREAAEIAKHVKHVHLTDNFGYSDSHLPIGMGNVPVKEIMESLGEQGSKARKINEVSGWFEHFKTNPFAQILEASGSPIYSTGDGPYWSQRTGFQQNYFGGYGTMLPSINYETFGAGFSRLPQELGGSSQQGVGGRMGGERE